jgi:hypothetical protein
VGTLTDGRLTARMDEYEHPPTREASSGATAPLTSGRLRWRRAHARSGRGTGGWSASLRLPHRPGEADLPSGALRLAGAPRAGSGAGSVRCAIGRRSHDRPSDPRCRRSASLARDHARLPRRTRAPQQGAAVSPPTRRPWRKSTPRCDDRHGWRLRALIVVLWRGGLRVQEAHALGERDLDPRRGSVLVRNGKGGRRREIGMDA